MDPTATTTILNAFADALIPPEGALPGALEVGSAGRATELVVRLPTVQRRFIEAELWMLQHLTRLAGRGRFSALSRERREAILAWLDRLPPLLARAVLPLKLISVVAYLEHPEVTRLLNCGPGTMSSPMRPLLQTQRLPVRRYPELRPGLEETFDVIIVGSGAGGAPMARSLARAGWSVAIVEEGDAYAREDFEGQPLDRLKMLYRDNGVTVTLGKPMVLMPIGKAVGGTTVVNSGTCFRTPDQVIDGWTRQFGTTMTPDQLAPYYDDVEQTLEVAPVPWDVMGNNGLIAHRGATALGIPGHPLLRNAAGCQGSGECAVGCRTGGKRGVHLNYLPQAVDNGAEIFARCRVDRIQFEGTRAVGVRGTLLGPDERHAGRFTLRARKGVVVAAGTVFSPPLLRRSGVRGRELGRNLRIHPCTAVTGLFKEDVQAWKGVLQSYLIDALADKGILLEATFPPVTLNYAEAGITLSGLERKEMLAHLPNVATLGVLVSDSSSGRLMQVGENRSPLLWYSLNEYDKKRLLEGMALASRVLFAAGAVEVYPLLEGSGRLRSLEEVASCFERDWPASAIQLTAYHPMGTARMGGDSNRVVDDCGRVRGTERLVVADASVFPSSLSVNPQMTIMAFAQRAADKILEEW